MKVLQAIIVIKFLFTKISSAKYWHHPQPMTVLALLILTGMVRNLIFLKKGLQNHNRAKYI